MRSIRDTLDKYWKLRERGIITDGEFARAFMHEVADRGADGVDGVDVYGELAKEQQLAIATYIQQTPMECITYSIIGYAPEEYVKQQTAIWQSIAASLRDKLSQ